MGSIQINIPFEVAYFKNFFCTYLIEGPPTCIVDVGPYNSHEALLSELRKKGVKELHYVLLTHIHIDHAGALGPILRAYPMARAVCHELGLRYLPNPDSFWDASLKVLKKRALEYGRPEGVPTDKLISHKDWDIKGIRIIPTPGHASHHISFVVAEELFTGEAAGNHFFVDHSSYLRPATPPRFFLDQAIKSVDLLMETQKDTICYAHCGKASNGQSLLKRFRQQLSFWHDFLLTLTQAHKEMTPQDIVEEILSKDKNLEGFVKMSPEDQEREREFILNSVNGFLGFIKENK